MNLYEAFAYNRSEFNLHVSFVYPCLLGNQGSHALLRFLEELFVRLELRIVHIREHSLELHRGRNVLLLLLVRRLWCWLRRRLWCWLRRRTHRGAGRDWRAGAGRDIP